MVGKEANKLLRSSAIQSKVVGIQQKGSLMSKKQVKLDTSLGSFICLIGKAHRQFLFKNLFCTHVCSWK